MSNDFDWEFYLMFNSDVVKTFGSYKYAALLHYNKHGKDEGRIINEHMLFTAYPFMLHFDCDYYRENNSDLRDIDNRFKLINHYLYQGYREGRKINFNTSIYPYFSFDKNTISVSGPLLSVIMPVYNRSELLSSAIESILNQTYQNIELFIINDGSNSNTMDVISKYETNDKVTILHNIQNYGCYSSINLALNLCNGTYITTHGSDDISLHDRFAKIIEKMTNNNLQMCGNYILRTHFPNFLDIDIADKETIFTKIITQNLLFKSHNNECCKALVSLGTLTYNKNVFDTLGAFENIRKGGDMVFFEKYLYKYENIEFSENDCSHRYLTIHNKGNEYEIIDEILYLSAEMTTSNITGQNIHFDINKYRKKLYNDID